MTTIVRVDAHDVRFPTSRTLDGSDAMNVDPDYSGAWCELHTDDGDVPGTGFTFTIGRGNELCVAAIRSLARLVEGRTLEEFADSPGRFWRSLVGDSQLRWLGPEKGVIHLATAAVTNALWDLWAKREGKPLWRLVCELPSERLVDCIDFRHIADVLPRDRALAMLRALEPTRALRIADIEHDGYPAYTTSAGWLGYPDEKIAALCADGLAKGWTAFKIKVGRDLDDDLRRCRLVRELIGRERRLMIDANQVWDVDQAIAWTRHLLPYDPWFLEEPTSPDDVLGHAAIARALAPLRVATGEHCHNRVMFKQFLQAGGMQVCQVDACRPGGFNEVLAILLLAACFDVPVCPHAGGVGLCELVQHVSIVDYVCVSASLVDRVAEYADHLHEHFVHPARVVDGRYRAPSAPGFSSDLLPASMREHLFPHGAAWASGAR